MKIFVKIVPAFCIVLLCGLSMSCRAGETVDYIYTVEDTVAYHRAMERLLPFAEFPEGRLMVKVAQHFYGTQYVAGTLEVVPEKPVIGLCRTDCILFVEMCTAIVELLKGGDGEIPPFSVYCDKIRSMRYRNGVVDGYVSRLHYTSEWIQQNSAAGIMEEVTERIGGNPLAQEFYFMTANSDKYPALNGDYAAVAEMREVEYRLDNARGYYSIPASEIKPDLIEDGDIVCFVSKTGGLDITHVGIAARDKDGSLHFIHASLKAGKVVFEPKTLKEYCRTSIRVVRLSGE